MAPVVAPVVAPVAIGWLDEGHRAAVLAATVDPGFRFANVALVDPAAQRVYVDGDVVALDTGAILVHGKLAAEPIAVLAGGAVAGVADGRVLLFDRESGDLWFRPERGVSFAADITRVAVAGGQLTLAWSHYSSQNLACCGGGRRETTTGTVVVDLATGHVTAMPPQPGGYVAGSPLPADLHLSIAQTTFEDHQDYAMIGHALVVARDGGATWSHPLPPQRRDPPRQAPSIPR